jgi:hypothetical protein
MRQRRMLRLVVVGVVHEVFQAAPEMAGLVDSEAKIMVREHDSHTGAGNSKCDRRTARRLRNGGSVGTQTAGEIIGFPIVTAR